MVAIELGTKAESLQRLAPLVTRSRIEPGAFFSLRSWLTKPERCLERVREKVGSGSLVVRSSALSEDARLASNAGAYRSVMGVDGSDPEGLTQAIREVVASYGDADDRDQVLVQRQVKNIHLSGVLFARELTTLAPYYVFNYDRVTGSTDSVTSGSGRHLETYVRFRDTDEPPPREDLRAALDATREIESLVGSDRIELELALDDDGIVWIFQVRWIASPRRYAPSDRVLADYLEKAAKKVEKLSRPHPHLLGTRSIFGVMPDWNPAEIVGFRPRALALTLYKELVTDAIWAYQRDNYGYRNLRSFPLLVSFLGVPFIDVRVSFNSFVPESLPDELAEKLVNHYIDRLVSAPHNHDKVEFEVVHSCFYPGVEKKLAFLTERGFEPREIQSLLEGLRDLTRRIIHPDSGLYRNDLEKIHELERRQRLVLDSDMPKVNRIYWLIEDCKRYGTLPFSGLARAAFIATEFLNGMTDCGILDPAERDAFYRSLNTVTNRMQSSLSRLSRGDIDRDEFLAEYGHLRPGTYELLSRRYDESFETYFGSLKYVAEAEPVEFELNDRQLEQLDSILRDSGLGVGPEQCMDFIRESIEGREWAKLVFTRSVSDALGLIEAMGAESGLERQDLAHLNISTILRLYSTLDAQDLRQILRADAEANREAFELTSMVHFPPLILSPNDVYHFHAPRETANYVTSKQVSADVIREDQLQSTSPDSKIVCIVSADPGYDWLFSRKIAGLITMFGGVNSHMAVRSAEQGLPAVIGCGKLDFDRWSQAEHLEIDCQKRSVSIIR